MTKFPPKKILSQNLWQNICSRKNVTKLLVMKNSQPIRELLGMNQHDMAMLLGVSRSHYAMFEIGKRDLPANATQILANMLVNVQTPTKVTKKNPLQAQINKEIYSKFERLLRENEYQQLLIAKKIEHLLKKNDKQKK